MQSQPHRLYALEVELPVRRWAVVRLKLHAQPPACFRSRAVGLELDAGPHAPARLPGPLLRRLGVERGRSEEHTSELQSHHDLVCRLLLEKKKARFLLYQSPRPKRRDSTSRQR